MKLSTFVIAATSVVAAAIAATGTATSFATESEAAFLAARDPQTITVIAQDYAFAAPEKISAGPTTIQLVNKGPEMHHVQLVRLEGGKTLTDLLDVLKSGEHGVPAWVTLIGGPNVPEPGQSSSATIALTPGNYAFVCLIPSPDGVPHLMKGMVRPLTVTPAVGMPATMPKADIEMKLVDYGFDISKPITAGKHIVKVSVVDAPQPHEVFFARLAPGKTPYDLLAWMEKQEGPPPAMPAGGTSMIGVGGSNTLTVDFKPGEYALLCFMPDYKDGKPHVMHGMVRQITVK